MILGIVCVFLHFQESRQVEIPKWVERILRIPGGGVCLLICLIPLGVLLLLLTLVIYLLCLPVRLTCRFCCGVKPEAVEGEAAANGAAHEQPNDGAAAARDSVHRDFRREPSSDCGL